MSVSRIACGLLSAAILAVAANGARADLLVGDYAGTTPGTATTINRFADDADGAATSIGQFGALLSASYMTYEPVENVVYVSDFYGKTIYVYPAKAQGNVAPLRTLNPAPLGQPRRVAISVAHDELYTTTSGCCLATYARTADGDLASALRVISWGGSQGSVTRLNNPIGVIYRAASDEIATPDYSAQPGNTYTGVVLIFARTAAGNTAPARTIEGPNTLLGTAAYGIAYDAAHYEILVLAEDNTTFPALVRINTYAGSAQGDAVPLRSIAGPAAKLRGVRSIAYDASSETIYVSEGNDNGSTPQVLAFPRLASGDVAPARIIAAAPGVTFQSPWGIEVVPSAAADAVFADGFEG